MNKALKQAIFSIGMLFMLCALDVAAQHARDEWQIRENLAVRLGAEWYKIGVLNRELAGINDVLQDIRNVELFPESVIGLSEDELVRFDREIEKKEKVYGKIQHRVDALRGPLADAMAILREMVAGQPVEEMFDVLEAGNVERISEMLKLKHEIDSAWNEVDNLMSKMIAIMNISHPEPEQTGRGIEQEFFEILIANLGLQSQQYYTRLNSIKDSLLARANPEHALIMYQIETHRIESLIKQERNDVAISRIPDIRKRYRAFIPVDKLDMLLVQALFNAGEYTQVLESIVKMGAGADTLEEAIMYRLQSHYALQEYKHIWDWVRHNTFDRMRGRNKNMALWMALESGIHTGNTRELSNLATRAVQGKPFVLHIMHALAKSFVVENDFKTALSVMERALEFKSAGLEDETARNKIQIAIAQVYYELGSHAQSLETFFTLLAKEENFEEALFGIIWNYVQLKDYQKAETSLRKLINQSPESPRAVEAMLIMAKRFVNKAQYEWKKAQYLNQEERRLDTVVVQLEQRHAKSVERPHKTELTQAIKEIKPMLKKYQAAPRMNYRQIASLYESADAICNLVDQYYQTGSFQEIEFSEKRETLLHQLDSLLLAVNSDSRNKMLQTRAHASVRQDIHKIKQLVQQSTLLELEAALDRYHWEKEYLNWRKEEIKYARKKLDASESPARDSASRARTDSLRQWYAYSLDSLVAIEDLLHDRYREDLIAGCKLALAQPLELNDEAYLRYQLAELHYEHENSKFAQAYVLWESSLMTYDSLMVRFRTGDIDSMPVEPQQPRLDHSQSIAQYRRLIQAFAEDTLVPAAHYSLAWCFNDMGNYDSAIAHMQIVAGDYGRNTYSAQAWMYLGEHAFEDGNLDKATAAYQAVMKHPESQWFDEALYKFAWTQYRLSNPEKAISSFLALVDLGAQSTSGKSLLEKESMDYIAISFSEADITGEKGLRRAAKFIKRFGDIEKGTQILHRLANVYQEQGRFAMAEKTYRTLLNMYPKYKKNPTVERELLAVIVNKLGVEEATTKKLEFFQKYNRKSSWAQAQPNDTIRAQGDSLAASVLNDAALSFHQLALQQNDSLIYRKAADNYETFIRFYPRHKNANECHYNLAEIMFSVGEYQRAAEEYMAVSRRYPDSKYRETAAWNAIVASQNLLKQEQHRLQ
ncbi:MAG: tetratricopeptide repeat protein [Chitinivibrionales bacterium]|nr:tetratricopeptide repeat protein [Chitinivibrionales bacterium]